MQIFQCVGNIFVVEFHWKVTFEIPHKIFYPYIERYNTYTKFKF